jgi:hypothetical protein
LKRLRKSIFNLHGKVEFGFLIPLQRRISKSWIKKLRERIVEKLDWLSKNFDDLIPLPLTGEWRGFLNLELAIGE